MEAPRGPQSLAKAISEVIALRGLAHEGSFARVAAAWREIAGEAIASGTRATAVNRGVLQVLVNSAPLLSELASFHKAVFVKAFKERYADLKIRDIKFKLRGEMKGSGDGTAT